MCDRIFGARTRGDGDRRGWLQRRGRHNGGPRDGADGAGGIAGSVGGAPRSVALLGAGSLGAVAACGCRGGGLALGGVTGPHAGPPGQRGGLSWPDQSPERNRDYTAYTEGGIGLT